MPLRLYPFQLRPVGVRQGLPSLLRLYQLDYQTADASRFLICPQCVLAVRPSKA